jgi:alpha-D-ribose 1-methylphosphonate 5-triphosphate synthase subunit PhnL
MPTEPSEAEPPKRDRRWFQFRLRTLLIGVTLLAVACGYVASKAKIVRDRSEWRINAPPKSSYPVKPIIFQGDPAQRPNVIRRWLGDVAIDMIDLPPSTPDKDIRTTVTLFPEAAIKSYRIALDPE